MKRYYLVTKDFDFLEMHEGELRLAEEPYENCADAIPCSGLLCFEGEVLTGAEGDAAVRAAKIGEELADLGWTEYWQGSWRRASAAEAMEIGLVAVVSDEEALAKAEEIKKRRSDAMHAGWNDVEKRIEAVLRMQGEPFKLEELRFAATDRCLCGAGFAYPKNCSPRGSWDCSAILLGRAEAGSKHSGAMPFAFYSVISEDQTARSGGRTTRPES